MKEQYTRYADRMAVSLRKRAMPTYARGAIGAREEMAKFKTALLKVMAQLQT